MANKGDCCGECDHSDEIWDLEDENNRLQRQIDDLEELHESKLLEASKDLYRCLTYHAPLCGCAEREWKRLMAKNWDPAE